MGDGQSKAIAPALLGQMLFLFFRTLADPSLTGQHRLHLDSYQQIIRTNRLEDSEFSVLVDEIFRYHIIMDQIISLPKSPSPMEWSTNKLGIPATVRQRDAVRLLGVSDELFAFMSRITDIRNAIREGMEEGEAKLWYGHLHEVAKLDACLKEWEARDTADHLYRQMLWVYLYRTVYPPTKKNNWEIREDLTNAVNKGIDMLINYHPQDPNQTVALAPAFMLGCAAFEPHQRDAIRQSIAVVKSYKDYKNSDTALKVLEEVWRLMDAKDHRSWDWQTVANKMGLDFLAT